MPTDRLNRVWHISTFLSRDEADPLRLTLQARRSLGVWLARGFVWHHFTTLTFAFPRSEERALTDFRRWLRRLEQRAKHGVGWFAALERGAAGRLHLHVLTAHTDHLESKALEKAWPCGRVDAARYDPARGAAYYLTKDIGAESVDLTHDIAPPHKLIRVLPTLDPVGAAESGR